MGREYRNGWREHLRAQRASGLTGAACCLEHGIAVRVQIVSLILARLLTSATAASPSVNMR